MVRRGVRHPQQPIPCWPWFRPPPGQHWLTALAVVLDGRRHHPGHDRRLPVPAGARLWRRATKMLHNFGGCRDRAPAASGRPAADEAPVSGASTTPVHGRGDAAALRAGLGRLPPLRADYLPDCRGHRAAAGANGVRHHTARLDTNHRPTYPGETLPSSPALIQGPAPQAEPPTTSSPVEGHVPHRGGLLLTLGPAAHRRPGPRVLSPIATLVLGVPDPVGACPSTVRVAAREPNRRGLDRHAERLLRGGRATVRARPALGSWPPTS